MIENATLDINALNARLVGEYRALVIQVARGGSLCREDTLLATLTAAGRSIGAFGKDLHTAQQRLKAAQDLEEAAGLDSQIQMAQTAFDAANEQMGDAVEKALQAVTSARSAMEQKQRALESLRARQAAMRDSASRVLSETADPTIGQAAADARSDARRCQQAIQDASISGRQIQEDALLERIAEANRQADDILARLNDPLEGMAWAS